MDICNILIKHSKSEPNSIALKNYKYSVSYERLLGMVQYYHYELKHKGITKGSRVILKYKDSLDWVIMFLSLLSLSCWVIPISYNINDKELSNVMKNTDTDKIVDDSFCTVDMDNYDSNIAFEDNLSSEMGILHMTSGSTGSPKFSVRTLEDLINEGNSFKETFKITCKDIILNVPSICHSYALGASCMASLVSGSCLYLLDEFFPRRIIDIIDKEQPSIMILVPVLVKALCNTVVKKKYDFSSLRVVLVGAGPVTDEINRKFKERFNIFLMSNYGSTETGGLVSRLTEEQIPSIGIPMYGVKVKITDEQGNIVPSNTQGELWVKCNYMSKQYYDNSQLEMDDEGFVNMGDIAQIDSEGYIYIKGRKKSMIKVGGNSVNPREVEEVILSIPGITDCYVGKETMECNEEEVKAFVVTRQPYTSLEIIQYCMKYLTWYKVPRVIEFRKDIPRNEIGKIKFNEMM